MINFIIWSPEYTDSSGGIMALHLLARDLANEGHNVLITTQTTIKGSLAKTLPDCPVPFDPERTMAIYPEIVSGNPFEANAKYVTRWLLNTPGVIGGDGKYGDTDLVYKYWDYFKAPDESKVKGYLRTMDAKLDLYIDRGQDRSGECYIVKKGGNKNLDKHSPHAVNIDIFKGDEYLADLFNEKETFISYDAMTFHSVQAALCGCLSIIIPDKGVTKEEYFEKTPHHRYGIAYGMDDIQHAKETQRLLRGVIQGVEDECKTLVRSYINECYKHMNTNDEAKLPKRSRRSKYLKPLD